MTGFSLKGADGSIWDLYEGTVRLAGKVSGMNMPKWEKQTRESVGAAGQEQTGSRAKARSGSVEVLVGGKYITDLPLLGIHRAWWKAWDPDIACTFVYTATADEARYLDVVFDEDDLDPDVDPNFLDQYQVTIDFTANDPFWYGDDVVHYFPANVAPRPFYPGPPFYINPGNYLSTFELTNPGDLDTWPIWSIEGPASGFSFVSAGQTLSGNFPIPEGSTLYIDTRPKQKRAWIDDGQTITKVTKQMSSWGFSKIPASYQVHVQALVIGTGLPSVRFTPRYRMWF